MMVIILYAIKYYVKLVYMRIHCIQNIDNISKLILTPPPPPKQGQKKKRRGKKPKGKIQKSQKHCMQIFNKMTLLQNSFEILFLEINQRKIILI